MSTTPIHGPPLPENEAERLAALRALNILDTPSEERFDRITRTAKRLFNVPIALITLVDTNRQWFKSCYGLNIAETHRSVSFCAHAIVGDDALVIPDTHQDARFVDNPLVTDEPYVRFYAGHVIRGPQNHKLGTLCILDRHPRNMEADDLQALRDLATWAQDEINASVVSQALLEVERKRELEQLTTKFVLHASHELRTPLTSIKGYVDLLLDGELGDMAEEQRQTLHIVRNNVNRLSTLINDLLARVQ